MRSFQDPKTILDGASTSIAGLPVNVKDFRHVMIEVSMVGFTGTIKFAGSFKQASPPDIASAKSPTNPWDYVQIKDLEDNAAIDGDTGIAETTATDIRLFEFNSNALTWVNAILSSVTAGTVTVRIIPFND